MSLSPAAVYALARGAGFDPAQASVMVAIAGAESGWNPEAIGDVNLESTTWGPSVGLWQIRSLHAQTGTGGPRDASRLKDPAFNAAAARSIFRDQGLSAWSTYSSGAYRRYLGATSAAAAVDPGGTVKAGGSSSGSGASVASSVAGSLAGGGWDEVKPVLFTLLFAGAGATLVLVGLGVSVLPSAGKLAGITPSS